MADELTARRLVNAIDATIAFGDALLARMEAENRPPLTADHWLGPEVANDD